MAGIDLSGIDWSKPWFSSIAHKGEQLGSGEGALCDNLNRLLAAGAPGRSARLRLASGKPLLFVPQSDLPASCAYETHVHDTGRVPTRDNLHDLFNGLVWFGFPHTKMRLNAMQAQALRQPAEPAEPVAGRGRLRDAVTLFDENGLVLACSSDDLAQALRRFDWRTLFIERRTSTLMQTEPWVVGHGLLEKLLHPYKSLTAHALIVPVDDSYFRSPPQQRRATVDRLVADWLANWPFFTPGDLCPLPVLGLPGWWPDNTVPGFYDDPAVFRPGRSRQR
ncbi:hypothetical protein PIGHUM_01625 [Pigmentiphaga humi]|uniref:DUF3025 domain-containing protein n=1 Tax=Pigmentiphaga humi TaxID=2478468 RepID=A0A3P4B0I6_9BURK|nr:DUF3025 domain-containing protein [Pigmentiphaga humi]VCU69562.1 hypothetical protein PIGHUM_01625 [Pigmentiphaga humi]